MPSLSQTSPGKLNAGQSPIDPFVLPLTAELLRCGLDASDVSTVLQAVSPRLLAALGADYVALVTPAAGRWAVSADAGLPTPLPADLLADVLDREVGRADAGWVAAPLVSRSEPSQLLAAHLTATASPLGKRDDHAAKHDAPLALLERLAPVCQQAFATIRRRAAQDRRLRRLEAILKIASEWNQTHEVEPLLVQMAEAATRLLDADRASIFLWDRPNHTLVGRPALGLPDGELRIPDDRGVVGQVIRTGQPRRADAASEPDVVDRKVDAEVRYETRTLLCVPLAGRSGELFGAFELINKRTGAFSQEDETALTELAAHAAVALENARDRQQLLTTNRRIAQEAADKVRLIGESAPIQALRSIIQRVAQTDLAVLVLGENGTGKEVVAQSIHYLSRRRDQPFVAVNCAAIPETLAESELFGHEKGAFTDAREMRQGKFELAAGGTLFLDEIAELSLACQAKLLRVLEEKLLVRVGGSTPIHTDARLLAASNQNLADMVRAKRFREDLYFRLNVVTVDLPPLAQRGDDILLLAEHFLDDFCRRARRKTPHLTAAARRRLMEHPWPGNVRELRNLMERLAYLSSGDRIEADDLAFILSPRGQPLLATASNQSLGDATTQFQIEYIRQHVAGSGGNMSLAAARLGMHRSNLYRKMRQLGMDTA
ncbi:MAG: sigma-54-dependent Fis family transcriptional regulator [Planctomycetaceae bacterium]|nr:sigma-54-dependent Fis family transcriptional regulator [Planctomycetaceae bacterium]